MSTTGRSIVTLGFLRRAAGQGLLLDSGYQRSGCTAEGLELWRPLRSSRECARSRVASLRPATALARRLAADVRVKSAGGGRREIGVANLRPSRSLTYAKRLRVSPGSGGT